MRATRLVLLLFALPAQAEVAVYCCDATAEAQYVTDLAALNVDQIKESFESGPWVAARSAIGNTPPAVPSVTSQGVTWYRDGVYDPPGDYGKYDGETYGLRTTQAGGAVHHGQWQMYASVITGTTHAWPEDGFSLTSAVPMFGVGGWYEGHRSQLVLATDNGPVDVNDLPLDNIHKFVGFIDPAGFTTLDVRTETELNEAVLLWADDFTIGVLNGLHRSHALEFMDAVDRSLVNAEWRRKKVFEKNPQVWNEAQAHTIHIMEFYTQSAQQDIANARAILEDPNGDLDVARRLMTQPRPAFVGRWGAYRRLHIAQRKANEFT